MEDGSGSASSLEDDEVSVSEDVWSPSLRENVFSTQADAAWSNPQPPSDLPHPRQEPLHSLSSNPPARRTDRQRPFDDPGDLHQNFDHFRPSNSFSRDFNAFRGLPRIQGLPHLNPTSPPPPGSPLAFDVSSPTDSQVSWNVLSSNSESKGPSTNTPDQIQRGRLASPIRRTRTAHQALNDFVDLTDETPPRTRMPSAANHRGPNKRRRVDSDASAPSPRGSQRRRAEPQSPDIPPHVEEVDLRDVDDEEGLSKVLEEQRMATIKAQQEQASRPVKLATLQCIICMDLIKDVTATHCGHLFCHSCLMEALIAGENQGSEPGKGPSKCPVCRKKIKRPGSGKRDTGQVVALEVMVRKRIDKGKAKERRGSSKEQQRPPVKRRITKRDHEWG